MKVEIKVPEHVIVETTDTGVIIDRKGLRSLGNRGSTGTQTIPYSSIISVDFKKASGPAGIIGGHIDFVTAAGNASTPGFGALMGAGSDYNKANAVVFRKFNDEMEQIKDIVESHMGQQPVSNPTTQVTSEADELAKFKRLLDQGVLTQEEFDAKKKQILGL